nr:FtsH protease activity modulator HflK [Clostridium sp. Marseille-P7770]
MMELIIWLVVIAVFVFRALKQNGTLDGLFAGAKKRKENQAERVVYEQTEENGNKEKKSGGKIRIPKHTGFAVTVAVVVFAAAILSFDSFYTLSEEEMAVVTTFGKPSVEEASGLHFKLPVIQRVTKVSKAITGMQIGYTTDPSRADGASIDNPVSIENESLMITKDFNLTNVDFYVEYMVTDPIQAVRHRSVYESIIKNLAQSYIRDTVGVYNVDDVITTGKTQIQERIKEQLTNRLVDENIGYGIYNVSIQDTEMPRDDVANAFKAVEDAKQGMETAINSAKKYQSENIPEAKAKADKLLQDAEAYKEQRINEANGQVARFEDTYAEYVKYPLITKKRMFYETMEEVLPDLKVIITGGNGTQTLLPLEPFSGTSAAAAAQTGGEN